MSQLKSIIDPWFPDPDHPRSVALHPMRALKGRAHFFQDDPFDFRKRARAFKELLKVFGKKRSEPEASSDLEPDGKRIKNDVFLWAATDFPE